MLHEKDSNHITHAPSCTFDSNSSHRIRQDDRVIAHFFELENNRIKIMCDKGRELEVQKFLENHLRARFDLLEWNDLMYNSELIFEKESR